MLVALFVPKMIPFLNIMKSQSKQIVEKIFVFVIRTMLPCCAYYFMMYYVYLQQDTTDQSYKNTYLRINLLLTIFTAKAQ